MADLSPLVAVLAAGGATRFGGGKLDADLAGKPVGQWTLDAVAQAGLEPGVIVVPGLVPRFALASGWLLLTNVCASDGLGTSLALAASAALGQGRSLLVLLADMPLIPAAHLAALAAQPCAATVYPDGKLGVPAMLDETMLSQVAKLAGAEGAGPLLAHQADLARLPLAAELLVDIDRPEDLVHARKRLAMGSLRQTP